MSESERTGSASARSTSVAHVMPTSWDEVAAKCAPIVARVDVAGPSIQVVALVPSSGDAAELARELGVLGREVRALGVGSAHRAKRLAAGAPHILVATPAVLLDLMRASAVKLDQVTAVVICAADEFESSEAVLELVLAEVPKEATRMLTTGTLTPFVERMLAAHMHGARRVGPALPMAPPDLIIEVVPVTAASPAASLGDVLEMADAPSAAIVPRTPRHASAAAEILAASGYPADSPFARMSTDGDTGGANMVVFVGPPSRQALTMVMVAPPARMVALLTTRERTVLEASMPGLRLGTFTSTNTHADAVASEEALRERIRRSIADGFPAREMFALEPLLGDFDPFVLAGAVLRLYERERDALKKTHDAARAAKAAAPKPAAGRDRPPRSDDRPRPPRSDDRGRPPRSDDRGRPPRSDDRGRPPRSGPGMRSDRGDRPPPRRDGPPRGDRPFKRSPDR